MEKLLRKLKNCKGILDGYIAYIMVNRQHNFKTLLISDINGGITLCRREEKSDVSPGYYYCTLILIRVGITPFAPFLWSHPFLC